MDDLKIKYANIILKECLNIKPNQPLFISANNEISDFIRLVANEAYKLGVKEIYFDIFDPYLKHDALLNLEVTDLKKMSYWHKEEWNNYAKKGAAFLMLSSDMPGLMKDISVSKLNEMTTYSYETRKDFDTLRDRLEIPWCIAAVPNLKWAQEVFPNAKDPLNKLWHEILNICLINSKDVEKIWQDKINKLHERCQKLNAYQFKTLKYENSLGTEFTIGLPKNHLWASGREILKDGSSVLVNFPTEEVFTSPTANSAEGIIYSSKPLVYQDNIIDKFYLRFNKGQVIDCKAKVGEENLKELINSCPNMDRLGEVALVEYDSPISKSNIIFFETLFDENASCHLALGNSFIECLKDGINLTKSEISQYYLNSCLNHVDFMVGTKDLKITGITPDNHEITIIENGNFTKEFK